MEVPTGSVIVKIYRVSNHGAERFTVCYYDAKGDRKQKMFADFDKAYQEAQEVGEDLATGESDALNLTNADRVIFLRGKAELEGTGLTVDVACRDMAQVLRVLGGRGSAIEAAREWVARHVGVVAGMTVTKAAEEMLKVRGSEGLSVSWLHLIKVYVKRFVKEFGSREVASVRSDEVAAWLRGLGGAPRSRNNARLVVGLFFKYCKERGWVARDHDGVKLVPRFAERGEGEVSVFTVAEMADLMGASGEEMVPFLAIGAFAGLRHEEIKRLDWREVRLAERMIEVTAKKAKTAGRRLVPITENLAKWLAPHVKTEGPVVKVKRTTEALAAVVRAAQEARVMAAEAAGQDPARVVALHWRKNGLRHSFISYRLAVVKSAAQVALEAGNSPAVIFRNYRELVREADAAAWFAIEPAEEGKVVALRPPEATAVPAAVAG